MNDTQGSAQHPPAGDVRQPSPSRIDSGKGGDPKNTHQPPKAGSEAAKDEERRTQPSRNRGVTDI